MMDEELNNTEINNIELSITENETDNLEDDFDAFLKGKSEYSTEKEHETVEEPEIETEDTTLSMVDEFKIQMFLGILFLLLDGVHGFIYKFISKYDISSKDISFDDDDKKAVSTYFRSPKVLNLINKLPTELIGFMHIEYIYFQKFQEIKEVKKQEYELLSDETEDKEVEESVKPKKKAVKAFKTFKKEVKRGRGRPKKDIKVENAVIIE